MTFAAAALLVLVAASAPIGPPAPSGEGRDPFQAPGAAMSDPKLGLKGMAWQHLRCASIVTGPGGPVATLQSAEHGSFFAKEGDRLRNAIVVKIDPERRGVLLREPVRGEVAGFREIVMILGQEQPIVREPASVDPVLPARP